MCWRPSDLASEPKLAPAAVFANRFKTAWTAVLCHRDMLLIARRAHEAGSMSDDTLARRQLLLRARRQNEC